ncbi:SRPBCC family protein [Propionibacteriaceae bacterium Y2011]|uniref:SRPBCC family protein n=1 Tax=Microlunatus sp. Y2014 TaxID=3418488 RepID=UPI003B4AD10A
MSDATGQDGRERVVTAERTVAAGTARIFELIADPAQQPAWDGNDNLGHAEPGQRVRSVGDVFSMVLSQGAVRENHLVEFAEGRLIAWRPSEPGKQPPGHLWRWELEPIDPGHTLVRHTYDWTELTDRNRIPRASATGAEQLLASIDRLAAAVEDDVTRGRT